MTAATTTSSTAEAIAGLSARSSARLAIPTFTSVEQERRHRQERLAAGFRVLGRFGLTTGIAGHITVRDPGDPETFWVNPLSKPFTKMRISDLLLVDRTGKVLHGDDVVNPAAFAIHSRIHAGNPHVVAACHSHAPWARPWSATGRLIEPTSQDATAFYRSQALVGGFAGVVLDQHVGDQIADSYRTPTDSAGGITVAVHANHGHITVGETVDEAVFWFVLFEQMCESQMRLEATGLPFQALDDATASHTNRTTGTHYAGWLGFQGLYAEITADQPDLFG